jgi:hypothetical protein cdifQ_04001071
MTVFVKREKIMSNVEESKDSEEFRNIFNQLVEDIDCKRSEIPTILGISYDLFLKIADYGKIPTPRILIRIADYFNVPLEYLLGKTKEKDFVKATTRKTFQERFKLLREKEAMSEYAVTQKLHVSTSYTATWKKPQYLPSLDYLITLSEIFKVSLDYLLGRTDDPTPYKSIDSY